MKKVCLFFSLAFLCAGVSAQTVVTWVGGTSSAYFTAANWSPATSMSALAQSEIVMIGNGTPNNCVHSGGSANNPYRAGKVNVLTGANFTIGGILYPWGTDSINGNVTINSGGDFSIRNIAHIGRNTTGTTITIKTGGKMGNANNAAFNVGTGPAGSNATINLPGGSLFPGGILNLATATGTTAAININGGGVVINNSVAATQGVLNIGAGGSIFIGGIGFLRIKGERVAQLNGLISDGRLTCTHGKTLSVTFDGTNTTAAIPQDPNSMITEYPDSVVMKSADLICVIEKSTGNVLSYRYKGAETVANKASDSKKYMYHDFTTSNGFETIWGATYEVVQDDIDFAHIVLKRPYTPSIGHVTPVDAELHYALKKNDKAIYVYSKLEHKPNYKKFDIGSWRQVWWIADNAAGINLCERIYTDSLRSWEMNSQADTYTATGIAEIIKQTSGVRAGKYDGKYQYSLKFWDNPLWGHASNKNNIGCWMVNTSCEYYNEGPMHHDLNAAAGIIHQCMNGVHYGDGGIIADTLTSWTKVFGPYLMLITDKTTGDANWAAAKERQVAEQALWPYSWVQDAAAYPLAAQRGNITGKFIISDVLKPAQTGANAWIGVTDLSDGAPTFQMESKNYQYWVRAGADGSFDLKNVRPGSYTFFAFVDGETGEHRIENVTVTAGGTTSLGDITRNINRDFGDLVWEIGKPNRTSEEFKLGDFDYCEGFVEQKFRDTFPNPIEYNTAGSDWSKLSYAHTKYPTETFAPGDAWKWRLNFTLPAGLPATGNARLTIAYASADHAQQWIYVNNETTVFNTYYPDFGDGNAFIRQANFAKYSYKQINLPMNRLKAGNNTITLVMPSNSLWVSHLMYDYLSLEVPGVTVLPVTLLSFNATATNAGKSLLTWSTATELNNHHFDIERSNDGLAFATIGQVTAINTSNGSAYRYIDQSPLTGSNYYRLKQVDFDGKVAYSTVQKVDFAAKAAISVYPNPATNNLFVQSDGTSIIKTITITDALGKTVLRQTNINTKQYTLDVSQLAKGMYFVKVNDGNKDVIQTISKN